MYTVQDLERAIIFATQKHSGQVRKGDGRLYIMHPFSVMARLYQYKESKNIIMLAICAILHDVYEDTDTTLEEITELFGKDVADIVSELTSDKAQIAIVGKTKYLCEKLNTISSYSLVIKLCDRLDNILDMDSMSKEFKLKCLAETTTILESLSNRHLSNTHINLINDIYAEMKNIVEKHFLDTIFELTKETEGEDLTIGIFRMVDFPAGTLVKIIKNEYGHTSYFTVMVNADGLIINETEFSFDSADFLNSINFFN